MLCLLIPKYTKKKFLYQAPKICTPTALQEYAFCMILKRPKMNLVSPRSFAIYKCLRTTCACINKCVIINYKKM